MVLALRVGVEGLQKDSEVVGMGLGGRAFTTISRGVDLPRKVLASSALPLEGSGPARGESLVERLVE